VIDFELAKSSSPYNPTFFQVLKLTNLWKHEKTIQFHLNAQQSLKTLVKFFWLKYKKCTYKVVLQSTCKVVKKTQFIAMNCYEITIINCQSWVNVRLFVGEGWKWIPLLLIMQQFVDGDYVYSLTNLIVNALLDYGEFFWSNLGSKPMRFYHIWCHKFSKF
jgi:hypothetical protein